ncbi:sodium-dependent neutral amino acid transporter B(0)AT2, partial [Eurytemora carolleeae]|uniref:sodium-dependent neutral amino acid transporter B(0)AT2 n=1 Tax=Eurytemora carolleeae TaxID=1294199 RepID=UPI000C77B633
MAYLRARSRSVGKLEAGFSGGRERILKLKQLRQNAQTNYQTITAGMQPEVRKPLRVAFTPLDQSEKLPKPKTVDAQQILEEDEEEEEEDEPEPDDGPDELEEGETWDSKMTFILATIGYAVGLGNIWRFPYLAQKNGGGAFLIPYFIALITLGLPMFILELAIGQRLRKGSIGVWKQISPYLGGLGLASAAVAFNVALYYNTIIAWCLKYLVQ